MVTSVLLLVLLLQIKHLFADFFWQTRWMVANKGTYGHPGGLAHAGIHAGASFLVLVLFGPPAGLAMIALVCFGEFVLHYHIDWAKDVATKRAHVNPGEKRFWDIAGTDQAVHQATYLAMVALVFV